VSDSTVDLIQIVVLVTVDLVSFLVSQLNQVSCYAFLLSHLSQKVTFERKLSDVSYTLAQVVTCESQLS